MSLSAARTISVEQIGTMDDIVFDHETGDTRYVVVDLGHHEIKQFS